MLEVSEHHDLPDDNFSDCGPQLISKCWTHLVEILRIFCKPSSSYHPQIDGQIKLTNQMLKGYLYYLINYQQDYWVDLLHLYSLLTIT